MDPIAQLEAGRAAAIESYGRNDQFKALSDKWRFASVVERYVYNFDWLGRSVTQYTQDIQAVQEFVWATRPDLIIETGIAHGGALILSASLLALLDVCDAIEAGQPFDPRTPKRKVIGADSDIRSHNRGAIKSHPAANHVKTIQGSSIAVSVVNAVKAKAAGSERVMVCLDSMHTYDHVLAELKAYAPLVTRGCYCVVFDTAIEELAPDFFEDCPWGVGNNPTTAVNAYLAGTC